MKRKSLLIVIALLLMTLLITACTSGSGGETVKQTATAWVENGGERALATVDLTGGWSVEFAPGAIYLYDKEIKEDTPSIAMAIVLEQQVYDDYYNDNKDKEGFEEKDGICSFIEEYDGTTNYLFMADDKLPILLDVDEGGDGKAIMERLTFIMESNL